MCNIDIFFYVLLAYSFRYIEITYISTNLLYINIYILIVTSCEEILRKSRTNNLNFNDLNFLMIRSSTKYNR